MRQTAPRPIRLTLGLAAAGALALAACGGSDSGGSDSTEAFCDDLLAIEQSDGEISDEEGMALLQAAADSAPAEISQEMNQFVDTFGELLSFDAEAASEEELADFEQKATDFEGSTAEIEAFAKENCANLPDDFFD